MLKKSKSITTKIRVIILAFLLILWPSFSFAAPVTEGNLFTLVNEVRNTNHLKAFKVNQKLTTAANNKLAAMKAGNYFAHTDKFGKTGFDFIREAGYRYVYAGENLANGFSSAEGIVTAWQKSPSHLSNILNPNFTDSGLAVGTDSQGKYLVVHVMAKEQNGWLVPIQAVINFLSELLK